MERPVDPPLLQERGPRAARGDELDPRPRLVLEQERDALVVGPVAQAIGDRHGPGGHRPRRYAAADARNASRWRVVLCTGSLSKTGMM